MPPAAPAPDGRPPDAAIFVAGMPRSGTSLMRLILGSHPEVAMLEVELPLWREIARAHAGSDLGQPGPRQRLIQDLVGHPNMRRAAVAPDGVLLADELAGQPAVTLGTVFAHAFRQVARRAGKARWGVKDPRSEFLADRIFAELPACRLVHLVRDPRDVLASQRAASGRLAQHVVSTVEAWRRSARQARRGPLTHAGAYVAVRYEDLVRDPARVVRDICPALGLTYRPAMVEVAGRLLRPPREAGGSGRLAEPISPRPVGRFRADLHPGDVRYVQWRAGREMRDWGYEAEPVGATSGRVRLMRRLGEEGAWRGLSAAGIWPIVSRALGRLPPGT